MPKLLVVDDEPLIHRLFQRLFEGSDYEIVSAFGGEEALALAAAPGNADALLLDLGLPDIDGYSVLGRLRRTASTATTPVILMSGRGAPASKLAGFQLGADDYVTKPFDAFELRARVESLFERSRERLDAHPLTGLPGAAGIEREARRRLTEGGPFALAYADLDHFKEFNDAFGFARGDEVLAATARVLVDTARRSCGSGAFVGHVGGDDFVVLADPWRMRVAAMACAAAFDLAAPDFYGPEARGRGWFEAAGRDGVVRRQPLVRLSLGVATDEAEAFAGYDDAVVRATAAKRRVKGRADAGRSAYGLDGTVV